jgi:hypothetical protein
MKIKLSLIMQKYLFKSNLDHQFSQLIQKPFPRILRASNMSEPIKVILLAWCEHKLASYKSEITAASRPY